MAKPVIPVTEAKQHLRVEHDLDDAIIAAYTEAAVDRTLQEIGLAGVLERVHSTETTLREFGFLYPVEEVTSVEKKGTGGEWQTLPAEEWTLSGNLEERHVLTLGAGHLSGNCYRVTWKAGLKPLPAWFRVAALFLIGHYYENRSSVLLGQGVAAVEVPMGFKHLTAPHKRWFFA
ncbi:head-tail connector protein [Luteolibacter soli]|uniref:Head-tail connector protein n=1 Tax=Luteolibacter soli TaxID=3135280 RepID=A0ABU9AYC2_9BACT